MLSRFVEDYKKNRDYSKRQDNTLKTTKKMFFDYAFRLVEFSKKEKEKNYQILKILFKRASLLTYF